MKFLTANRLLINIVISLSCVVDVGIAFIINKLSGTPFSLWKKENIISGIILLILVIILIVCNILISNQTEGAKPKKLQKAFQQSGGYDVVANELKVCIQDGNVKRLRDLKKMVKIIEQ